MVSAIRYFIYILIFLTSFLFSIDASANDSELGPPLEFGGGIAYTRADKNPEWSTENYKMGILCGGIRFFRGLSFQGGIDAALGEDISLDSVEYGDELKLEKIKESFYETTWIGLRYEVPVPIDADLYRINSIHATLGFSWARYSLTSTEWIRKLNGVRESDQSETKYLIARLSGPYAMLCARWRLDTDASISTGSWFGSYGVDVGLKYSRYTNCNPRYDTIMKADSGFSVLQVFFVGFVKIRFFD